jgi:hypothetical protein
VGVDGNVHVGAGLDVTARYWARWAVVRCRLLIGLFKLKCDYLDKILIVRIKI